MWSRVMRFLISIIIGAHVTFPNSDTEDVASGATVKGCGRRGSKRALITPSERGKEVKLYMYNCIYIVSPEFFCCFWGPYQTLKLMVELEGVVREEVKTTDLGN